MEIDAESDDITVSIPVTHFSTVNVFSELGGDFSETTMSASATRAAVGESIDVTVVVRLLADRLTANASGQILEPDAAPTDDDYPIYEWERDGDRWALFGEIRTTGIPINGGGQLSPPFVSRAPPPTSVFALSFTVQQTFTCERLGRTWVSYRSRKGSTVPVRATRVDRNGARSTSVTSLPILGGWTRVTIDCVAPSPTATAPNLTAPGGGRTLEVPSIGGATPTATPAPVTPSGALPSGDYRVAAAATNGNCAGRPASFDKSLLIEVRGTAGAQRNVTIWDARTPYRGTMQPNGTFEAGSGPTYSGVLKAGFPTPIAFSIEFPGCVATYRITLTPTP